MRMELCTWWKRGGKTLLGWREQKALGIILNSNHLDQVLLTEEAGKLK